MSVSEFQSYLLKYRKYLAIFVALSIIICGLYIGIAQKYTAEIYIKYTGENAINGFAEDGSELNPYEISDAYIVKRALDSLGVENIDYSAVRRNIAVSAIIPTAEEEKHASWIENFSSYEENEENREHAVYYSVKFTSDTGADFANKFLRALVEQYRVYYVEKYVYDSDITMLSDEATLSYDYFETADILESKIKSNIEYLKSICDGDLNYRAAETGYSVNDLIGKYRNLMNTDLSNVYREIVESGSSKNSAVLKTTVLSKSDKALMESNTYAAKAATQKELMDVYSRKNSEYMWDNYNSSDAEDQISQDTERDRIYNNEVSTYDRMMLDYVNYSVLSQEFLINKAYYDQYANYLWTDTANAEIEASLASVCEKFNEIHSETEKTVNSYNTYKAARYISCVSGVSIGQTINTVLYYLSSVVLSLALGIIVIVFVELKRKKVI